MPSVARAARAAWAARAAKAEEGLGLGPGPPLQPGPLPGTAPGGPPPGLAAGGRPAAGSGAGPPPPVGPAATGCPSDALNRTINIMFYVGKNANYYLYKMIISRVLDILYKMIISQVLDIVYKMIISRVLNICTFVHSRNLNFIPDYIYHGEDQLQLLTAKNWVLGDLNNLNRILHKKNKRI